MYKVKQTMIKGKGKGLHNRCTSCCYLRCLVFGEMDGQ